MSLTFSNAVNGDQICFWNSQALHSTYNPQKEAERFINTIDPQKYPSYIIFLGPALPYCIPYLRKRFPSSQLIAIQFIKDFMYINNSWDYQLIFNNQSDLSEQLFSIIGEESSSQIEIISWNPGEKIFPKEYKVAINGIKEFLYKSKDVLGTRIFFSKRWFQNTINFFSSVKSICIPNTHNKPVLIVASGPSLEENIESIKHHRDSFYIIALSSSLSVLAYHSLKPDICVSTDGGFWAKEHLKQLSSCFKKIPVAFSPESSIPSFIYKTNPIIPLNYNDGFSSILYKYLNLPSLPATRNGTVSGTALFMARTLSKGPIVYAGLDLSSSKGHQHSQPNNIELLHETTDCKLSNKETRNFYSSIKTKGSLLVYENWFSTLSPSNTTNVFRLKPQSYTFINNLNIQEMTFLEVINFIKTYKNNSCCSNTLSMVSNNEHKSKLIKLFNKYLITMKDFSKNNFISFYKDPQMVELAKSISFQKFLLAKKTMEYTEFSNMLNEMYDTILSVQTRLGKIYEL